MSDLREKIKTVVHRMKFTCTIPNEDFDEIISLCQPQWISVETRLPSKKCFATYKNSAGMRRIVVATYMNRWEVESEGEEDNYDEYNEELDNYFYCQGWYEQQDNWGDYASIFVNEGDVTHWQPLLEIPNE